jgi:hypothetical protein
MDRKAVHANVCATCTDSSSSYSIGATNLGGFWPATCTD